MSGALERIPVKTGPEGALLVFCRLYWPGYQARLNGEALTLEPLDTTLVSVQVPPNRAGIIDLEYTPLGTSTGWTLMNLGLLLIGGLVFPWRYLLQKLRERWAAKAPPTAAR